MHLRQVGWRRRGVRKSLTKVPPQQWVHFDIQFDLGQPGQAKSPKTYRLAIAVAGKEQVFESVAFEQPEFSHLTWFGFSSSGKPGSVFYVDNVKLELLK